MAVAADLAPEPSPLGALCGGGSGILAVAPAAKHLTISSFTADEPIGKLRGLNADGTLRKIASAPRLQTVTQLGFDTIEAFARYASNAPASEAFGFGLCAFPEASVAVADADKRDGVVARTKEFFRFADAPGVILVDYDPLPGDTPLSAAALVDILRAAVPELRAVAMAAKPSSSAHLVAPDGSMLVGAAGVHVFLPVHSAAQIPALGEIIAERLWLGGHGRIKVTANGRRLYATLIDSSVWSPERLCFTRAACRDGVEQRFPPAEYFPGDCDDLCGEGWLADLAPLNNDERKRLADLQAEAFTAAEPEARKARERWADAQLAKRAELAVRRGETIDADAVRATLMRAESILPADLVLYPHAGEPITAGEVYAQGAQGHGVRYADPFEPGYGNDSRIALAVFEADEPYLFSHAHGGVRYYFRCKTDREAEVAAEFDDLGAADDRPLRKFEATPAGEFIQGKAPAWLIKGVLPEAALGVVYGASGSGKTFFVLDMVASVALGTPWREQRVTQRKVAYICAEGVAGFRNRIQAYMRQHNANFGDQLLIVAQPPNLLDGADAKEIVREIERSGAKLVVVDTFAQVTPGADENSAADMGKALRVCRDIHTTTGALVLLVHHTGKDPSRGARGWSGTRAAADVEIEVSKSDGGHVATITKMKDGEDGRPFGFKLLPILLGHDDDGDEINSCVVSACNSAAPQPAPTRHGAKQRAILCALHDLVGFSPEGVQSEEVLLRAIEALPFDAQKDGRDRRREIALRALKDLIGKGEIMEADGRLKPADFNNQDAQETEQ